MHFSKLSTKFDQALKFKIELLGSMSVLWQLVKDKETFYLDGRMTPLTSFMILIGLFLVTHI